MLYILVPSIPARCIKEEGFGDFVVRDGCGVFA